ncbi:MAG: general secretion pathway protein GspK [Oligoflexia bacterium]|nr:general secretion pathway protein GspK [Oligoflexia bacterium]
MLVVFIVALASILVLNLTYSSFVSARVNRAVEHGLQAEYMLKSAVSFARVLLREDHTPEDGTQDLWGKFSSGAAVPLELLGINSPNTSIELEIRPEESKFPLRAIIPTTGGEPDKNWRDAAARLFKNLGFDEDEEKDQTGYFPDRHFKSDELVANLIDYLDQDSESYDPGDFAKGIESELPDGTFPNGRILRRVGELKTIPGFTPNRMRKLEPLVTIFGANVININLCPGLVLKSLSEELTDANIEAIVAFRKSEEGPFTFENRKERLGEIIGDPVYDKINAMITVESRWFQVLAKVDYQTSTYFMRAYVSRDKAGALPQVRSIELF